MQDTLPCLPICTRAFVTALTSSCVVCCALQILAGRTEKRQIGGKAGNSFSVGHQKAIGNATVERLVFAHDCFVCWRPKPSEIGATGGCSSAFDFAHSGLLRHMEECAARCSTGFRDEATATHARSPSGPLEGAMQHTPLCGLFMARTCS